MDIDFSPALEQLEEIINGFIASLPSVMVALIVLIIFYVAGRSVRAFVRHLSNKYRRHQNLGLALGVLSWWAVILTGLLVAAVIVFPNFTPARLIQLLGISSIAIGFAFRDILQNSLAGILLLLTEPFRIGDQIVANDYEGTVEDIRARATTIITYDGRRVVIPNIDLFIHPVTVNTALDMRREEYDLGIGYSDNIEQAKELILEAIRSLDVALDDPPPDVLVVELGSYSVILRVRWWIKPPRRSDALDTRDLALTAIKRRLTTSGIDLPFPTQQILFHDQTEETDGDRVRQREGWPPVADSAPEPRTIAGEIRKLVKSIPSQNQESS